MKCPEIDFVPLSTNTTSGNSVGDTISFNCTEGYEFTSGNAELTCSNNGTWIGKPPTCCEFPLFCGCLKNMSLWYLSSCLCKNHAESEKCDTPKRGYIFLFL